MSRFGLRMAAAFAFVVAVSIAFATVRSAEIVRVSQEASLEALAADRLSAVTRVLEEEADGIADRLAPLALVREVRFRVQPAAPSAMPGSRGDDVATEVLAGDSGVDVPADSLAIAPDSSVRGADDTPVAMSAGPVDPVGLQRFVEEVLPVTGLDLLDVIALDGTVLARGHYPEAFGEAGEAPFSDGADTVLFGVRDAVFREGERPVLFTTVPIVDTQAGTRALVGALTGAVRLDSLVQRLARLTGSVVELRTDARTISSWPGSGLPPGRGLVPVDGEEYWAAQGEVGRAGILRVLVPAGESARLRRGWIEETVRYGAVAIAFAALAGIVLALGPTRRLSRLTRAAVRIGAGDLETPVAVAGRDEIGILGSTIAGTVKSLKEERERLKASERVAAWRDAARRLAHELKNAITPIGLSLRTVQRAMEKGVPGRAVAEESICAIASEMEQLRSLVDQFSQFARLPAPRPAPYDIIQALRAAATLHGSSGTAIRFRMPDRMAALLADDELMGRVWANLFSNAVAAAGPDGWVEVRVELTEAGGCIVSITDSGPGLARERIEGAAGEGTSTKPGGWGLGLALSERIVVEHGGEMRLENSAEAGARVAVVLPPPPRPGEA